MLDKEAGFNFGARLSCGFVVEVELAEKVILNSSLCLRTSAIRRPKSINFPANTSFLTLSATAKSIGAVELKKGNKACSACVPEIPAMVFCMAIFKGSSGVLSTLSFIIALVAIFGCGPSCLMTSFVTTATRDPISEETGEDSELHEARFWPT